MNLVQDFSYSPKLTVGVSYNRQRYDMGVFYWSTFNIFTQKKQLNKLSEFDIT